jgi:hypothetical protein
MTTHNQVKDESEQILNNTVDKGISDSKSAPQKPEFDSAKYVEDCARENAAWNRQGRSDGPQVK